MKGARSAQRTAAALGLLVLTIVAGRMFRNASRNHQRSRFLSESRFALGLIERRRGPSRGVSARANRDGEAVRADE